MNAIETHNLQKRYGNVTAVAGLDLTVAQGELFALLGVNGAGKTTTLRMLSCLTGPTGGDARLLGKSILREGAAIKSYIAVSPQETAVAPNLTVQENIALLYGIHGLPAGERTQRIGALAERLGLDAVLSQRAGCPAGGKGGSASLWH